MDDLFEKIPFLFIVVLSLIAWIRKQMESKKEEADAQRAREEMIRGLEEMQKAAERSATQRRQGQPPPIVAAPPQVSRNRPAASPPPLVWLPQTGHPATTPPPVPQAEAPARFPAPAPRTDYQAQLEQARRASQESGALAEQARAKRLRAAAKAATAESTATDAPPIPGLRQTLRDKGRVRQAVVLREILGPPLALREG